MHMGRATSQPRLSETNLLKLSSIAANPKSHELRTT